MGYLTGDSPDAFLDWPEPKPKAKDSNSVLCPVCKGYGGWNLRVRAYGLPKGLADTPENRHKYVHFRATCNQCHTYGLVSPEDAKCIHQMNWECKLGNCYNRYKCTKCGV